MSSFKIKDKKVKNVARKTTLDAKHNKIMTTMINKKNSIEKLKIVSSNENCIKLESFFGRLIGWSGIYFKKIMKMGAGG